MFAVSALLLLAICFDHWKRPCWLLESHSFHFYHGCKHTPPFLHHINLQSADTSNGFQQTFQVVSSKETRDYRRIIKPFIIFTNQDCYLYPVRASIVLRYHPSLSHLSTRSSLFVNSRCPQEPLATLTISTCLHNTIRISTEERNVSVRTIASSLALCHGIPKEDSVILGNWTNSPTFENHYRREHMPCFNFT